MERCDFSSIITTLRRYISDDYITNQTEFLEDVFQSCLENDSEPIVLDMGLVCRWFTGQARISPKISQYYAKVGNRAKLADDLENNVLRMMYDSSMAAQEVYRLLMQDDTISERVKKERSQHYPCDSREEEAWFIADVLCFGMEREFVKRDARVKNLLADGKLSPVLSDFIADEGAPKPCRHFCGREKELETLHDLLLEHGKVFLHGIAGIGKSELAKAYAKQHRKEYTNVLYLTYTGNLMQDIADMDFADDLPNDSDQERFRKHNRFMRTLKEDTLLIIDNFNTTASQDSTLSVVMKYRCRVLFTTRSRFDNYTSMEVEEIADKQALLSLAGCFYSDAERHQDMLALNEDSQSVFYGHIDTENIGIAGHSQGGVGAINAVTQHENGNKYKAICAQSTTSSAVAYALNLLDGELGGGWNCDTATLSIPAFMVAGTGNADAGNVEENRLELAEGETQGICPLWWLRACYDAMPDSVSTVIGRLVGKDHGDIPHSADGYMTAWFMYWLQGDEEAGKAFFGENAEIKTNENWQDVTVNIPQ